MNINKYYTLTYNWFGMCNRIHKSGQDTFEDRLFCIAQSSWEKK